MSGYVKLYGSILTSSVWSEPHHVVRVWITMLATADRNGVVEASIPGLANQARVNIAECIEALEIFKAPDPFSRTKAEDGIRIEEAEIGWRLLNHEKYRDMRTETQADWAESKRKWREGKAAEAKLDKSEDKEDKSLDMSSDKTIASSSSSSSKETTTVPRPADESRFGEVWGLYPKRDGSNPKKKAFGCFRARLREGVPFEDVRDGVVRYAQWCKAKDILGTTSVMQAVRFFGTEKEFLLPWKPSSGPGFDRATWEKAQGY